GGNRALLRSWQRSDAHALGRSGRWPANTPGVSGDRGLDRLATPPDRIGARWSRAHEKPRVRRAPALPLPRRSIFGLWAVGDVDGSRPGPGRASGPSGCAAADLRLMTRRAPNLLALATTCLTAVHG